MKSLDPKSGLKQISSGKLYLPRRPILELVRKNIISPGELGYYIIAVISADWTADDYRYGLIRHELKKLGDIWNIPSSTIHDNFKKLVSKGLLSKKHGVHEVKDFEHYEKSGGKYSNKNTVSNEDLELIFGKSLLQSEISDINQAKETETNKIPNKVEHNSEVIKTTKRTDADYQRIYLEGCYQYLVPEDMRWLDEHFSANGSYIP